MRQGPPRQNPTEQKFVVVNQDENRHDNQDTAGRFTGQETAVKRQDRPYTRPGEVRQRVDKKRQDTAPGKQNESHDNKRGY
jgi:hypothetical protein